MTEASILLQFGAWDAAFFIGVIAQCTLLAYLPQPRWKALTMSVPVPFTLAFLALGKPIDATHVSGLLLLLAFTYGVWVLHGKVRLPIVAAIVLSALAYCALAVPLAQALPATDPMFWSAAMVATAVASVLYLAMPHRDEPEHRSPLPLWAKLPAVAGVILFIVALKQLLSGFMTLFPMVAVVATYEARHSLGTVCRQIPVIVLAFVPMMATIRLTQDALGPGIALLCGWGFFMPVVLLLSRRMWLLPPKPNICDSRRA